MTWELNRLSSPISPGTYAHRPQHPALERMTGAGAKIIASGGVAALEDIQAIAELTELGVMGVIIGKALYSGRFTLPAAIEAARAVARSAEGMVGFHK